MKPLFHHLCPCNDRMAAYPEPRPEQKNNKPSNSEIDAYYLMLEEWQSSLTGYMKEPGFEEGDIAHPFSDEIGFEVEYVDDVILRVKETKEFKEWANKWKPVISNEFLIEDCSHYHEGQKLARDRCRFVRAYCPQCKNELGYENKAYLCYNCERVSEIIEWQEVKEPAHQIESLTRKNTWEQNPEWEKFLQETTSGTILIEEIKINH